MPLLALALMLALILVVACSPPSKPQAARAGGAPITKEYQIEARQFSFTPNEIRVPVGSPVRLIVRSQDVDHQLTVRGISLTKNVVQGRAQTIEFVAWKPGTYQIGCAVVCGTGHDRMTGALIIE